MSRENRDRSLRELMDRRGLGALLLSSPANFAWYTGGADNRVDHGDPVGVASVLVTTDEAYILTNNIEAPRMREEQTPEMEVVEHPWPEEPAALLRELTGGSSLGTDFASEFGPDLSAEISPFATSSTGTPSNTTVTSAPTQPKRYPRPQALSHRTRMNWTLRRSYRRHASGVACSPLFSLPPLRSASYAIGIRSRTAGPWESRPCSSSAPSAADSS